MEYFFIFGLLVLCILTYKDIKSKMVDSRPNWLMHGVALSLASHYSYNVFIALLLVIGFYILKPKLSRWIGKGDLTAIHWILYGTFIISPYMTMIFLVLLGVVTILYGVLKLLFFGKNKMATPFYPVILSTFSILSAIYFTSALF